MIELLFSLFIGWLLIRWLSRSTDWAPPPPAPPITIHVHGPVLVQSPLSTREGSDLRHRQLQQ